MVYCAARAIASDEHGQGFDRKVFSQAKELSVEGTAGE
jgi:hypothetical protein